MTDEARDSSAVAGRDATLTTTAKGGQELPQATIVTGDDRRHFRNDFDKNAISRRAGCSEFYCLFSRMPHGFNRNRLPYCFVFCFVFCCLLPPIAPASLMWASKEIAGIDRDE